MVNVCLPAKVSTFLESSKLFVEESKTLPSDFCMKTSVTVTANVQNHCALGVTLVYKDYVHMGSLHSPPVHRGGWNPRGKGGKVLAAIFGEFAWHSVIDGIGAFF